MRKLTLQRQNGMTLIEVLVSVLILAIGLLGAAAIQLNALRYTDSATISSQASFIAYDMMDRIRANVDGNASANGSTDVLALYDLPIAGTAPVGNQTNAKDQDLADFRANIEGLPSGTGSIVVKPNRFVTITVGWDDTRAAAATAQASGGTAQASNPQKIEITSRIGVTP
ncbi:type IV pilus modification protein PilV [Pseudomonas sp. v388]|uniref:type IV pilus modification protein PilV n=1 Tax=Pseudomonas sp. v388 TaxID=2479849 RepID=UPI002114D1D9|nr:type IV pilus modification protein PilV [Pseudomonas sp. v388]